MYGNSRTAFSNVKARGGTKKYAALCRPVSMRQSELDVVLVARPCVAELDFNPYTVPLEVDSKLRPLPYCRLPNGVQELHSRRELLAVYAAHSNLSSGQHPRLIGPNRFSEPPGSRQSFVPGKRRAEPGRDVPEPLFALLSSRKALQM